MIPKIIHYCWIGGNSKPESVLKCIESWKKYCPDYEIKEWNESNLDFTNAPEFVRQAYSKQAWGFVPDYFRLWIIYHYGGIYLDTDVQIVRNFDSLLIDEAFAGFEDENHVALGLGFGSEKGNAMIYDHMLKYHELPFLNADGSLNRIPSPVITTEWLCTKGLVLGENKIQEINGLKIYPKEYFAPKDFDTGITKITKNTYSIHQYDASWFTDEEKNALEKSRRKYKIDRIRYAPNRLVIWLLGEENYEKLKLILKK